MKRLFWSVPSLLALCCASAALARVGGGQSFHSGGHSYGSGGSSSGGGGADLVVFLIRLAFAFPQVGVPLGVIVLVGWVALFGAQTGLPASGGWSTQDPPSDAPDPEAAGTAVVQVSPDERARLRLKELRSFDPEFSSVLLEDFLYSLYAEVQRARPRGLDRLSAYLGPAARATLGALQPAPSEVHDVIVGQLRYVDLTGLQPASPTVRLRVAFETNYTERRGGSDFQLRVLERWTLERAKSAKTKPPLQTRTFKCPCCGAPLDGIADGRCSYCKNDVATGDFDWLVAGIEVFSRDLASKADLYPSEPPEYHPTQVALGAIDRLAELEARDPAFGFPVLQQRVERVFVALQRAWSELDWKGARPYVSDRLFENEAAFLERYQREGLRDILERQQLVRCELCDIESDPHYDQARVRILGKGIDCVVDRDGTVLSGSRHSETTYAEYWTFIRGRSLEACAAAQKRCPNCGADLDINMGGSCPSCHVQVTAASFDWVLSAIRQDDD
ncbi:MAG: Tim44 domain-containing protein [Deltaproteobacteria bacterium]